MMVNKNNEHGYLKKVRKEQKRVNELKNLQLSV